MPSDRCRAGRRAAARRRRRPAGRAGPPARRVDRFDLAGRADCAAWSAGLWLACKRTVSVVGAGGGGTAGRVACRAWARKPRTTSRVPVCVERRQHPVAEGCRRASACARAPGVRRRSCRWRWRAGTRWRAYRGRVGADERQDRRHRGGLVVGVVPEFGVGADLVVEPIHLPGAGADADQRDQHHQRGERDEARLAQRAQQSAEGHRRRRAGHSATVRPVPGDRAGRPCAADGRTRRRALSSAGEHSAYTRAVTGSIPVAPTSD